MRPLLPKHRGNNGGAGYPSLRLLILVSCGTRTVLDAVFGPTTTGETSYAPRLVRSLHEGMIVLLDRNFAVQSLIEAITQRGAHVLVRVKEHRRLPVLQRFPDGSYLSRIGAATVRVIDCEITVSTAQGRRTGSYRLVTTLTDARTHPAAELVKLYHERWEVETSYLEIKSTILGGRVLRPGLRPASSRKSSLCWSPIRSCDWRWQTPPLHMQTPTGPASPSP
jgi:hypothetical protein